MLLPLFVLKVHHFCLVEISLFYKFEIREGGVMRTCLAKRIPLSSHKTKNNMKHFYTQQLKLFTKRYDTKNWQRIFSYFRDIQCFCFHISDVKIRTDKKSAAFFVSKIKY